MTYYRRSAYPAASNADIPDDMWREFQRIRDHFMRLDQNNTKQAGITRARIASPYSAVHDGVSDVSTSAGVPTFARSAAGAAINLIKAEHDGVWLVDPDVSLKVYSRWDAHWIIGFSAEFTMSAALADHMNVDLTVGVSGESSAIAAGYMDVANTAAAVASWYCVFLPAGTSTISLLYRARWDGAYAGGVAYSDRFLFAVGLYR